jgi:hypothetical protein
VRRGIEKPPFQLPSYIADTGIAIMRDGVKEKEAGMSLKDEARRHWLWRNVSHFYLFVYFVRERLITGQIRISYRLLVVPPRCIHRPQERIHQRRDNLLR